MVVDRTDIAADSLVVVIDVHAGIDVDGADLDGWAAYGAERMELLRDLLAHCNARGIPLLEALYYGERHPVLRDIRFAFGLSDVVDYSAYACVYIVGISLTQCLFTRPVGYFRLDHPNRAIILNCSLQGPEYRLEERRIAGLRVPFGGRPRRRFASMAELHAFVELTMMARSVRCVDWIGEAT